MNTRDLSTTLTTLFGELLDGPPPDAAYMLNRGDVGLLRSLDRLSAAQASAVPNGGASIAAHVAHLSYGLSLMNRWSAGENPFDTADWSTSWRTTTVSHVEWEELRAAFAREARRWLEAVQLPRDVTAPEMNGIVGSIAHLAYHLGSIRQIDRSARGPVDPHLVRSEGGAGGHADR
jgi:hypothetical protein